MTSFIGANGLQGLSAYPDAITPAAELGWQPILIEPIFTRGQDWIVTLTPACTTPDTTIWPAGTIITANIYPRGTNTSRPINTWTIQYSWPATITGNNVDIKAPYTDTDTVQNGALMRIVVVLDTGVFVWAQGCIARN